MGLFSGGNVVFLDISNAGHVLKVDSRQFGNRKLNNPIRDFMTRLERAEQIKNGLRACYLPQLEAV